MNSKDEERLAAFEKMLEFVQKNHDDTEAKMEILRGGGKKQDRYLRSANGQQNDVQKSAGSVQTF